MPVLELYHRDWADQATPSAIGECDRTRVQGSDYTGTRQLFAV